MSTDSIRGNPCHPSYPCPLRPAPDESHADANCYIFTSARFVSTAVTKTLIARFLKTPGRASPSGHDAEDFLRLFKKHRPAIYSNLALFEMNFIQLSFPLLYARCRAGYRAVERPEFLSVTNDRRHYVLPLTNDWRAFVAAVIELVSKGGRVMSFPKLDSMPNRSNRHPEYACATELLANMPGRKLKTYRRDAQKLEELGVRIEEGPGPADDLYGMNKRWYSDFEERKGFRAERLPESEALISLAGLAPGDDDLLRVFRAVIAGDEMASESQRKTAKLCGFLITCRLSETFWASVLSRSLIDHSGVGHYMWHKAAQVYLKEGVPLENDGADGGDPALGAYKRRFSNGLIQTHQLWSGWLSGFL